MAKTSSMTSLIKTIQELSAKVANKGIIFLSTEDETLNGRFITIKGKQHVNFGSCGYLGLEMDPRLKEGAINAIKRYGSQYSSSRSYVSYGLYQEYEDLVSKIFDSKTLISTCTTMGHLSVMPTIISENDALIYDQQAHVSMHETAYKISHNGTNVSLLRHNRLDELEAKVAQLRSQHERIWYAIDGVYSMFGDYAPLDKIVELADKYKQLWLYIDDAHGMSWCGPNGSGYTRSQYPKHPKMVIGTSLSKSFAAGGGAFSFPNEELYTRVKQWGGPLTYSGPMQPGSVGAGVASAKIHLSGEIYEFQKKLREKIAYCNHVFENRKIPLIANNASPIFFVGLGTPLMGFNMIRRIMDEGLYTNLGIFPAVPETCTGMRFTITNHIEFEDIDKLADKIEYHLPKALKEEGRSYNDIVRAFRKFANLEDKIGDRNIPVEKNHSFTLEKHNSISEIDATEWDTMMADRGIFDAENLLIQEKTFTEEKGIENHWDFKYYIIRDETQKPVIATFFTKVFLKDDMLSDAETSKIVQSKRTDDAHYLCSHYFTMGSMLTNGNHLYIDKSNSEWKKALMLLIEEIWSEYDKNGTNTLYLREFDESDNEVSEFFTSHGFVKIHLPLNHIISNIDGLTIEEFLSVKLNKKRRKYLKVHVLDKENLFTSEAVPLKEVDPELCHKLYLNVQKDNLSLNSFPFTKELFKNLGTGSHWEILKVSEKTTGKLLSITISSTKAGNYCPVLYGRESEVPAHLGLYKQTLFQILKRALALKSKNVYLGLTADDTKSNVGAKGIPQVGFAQVKETFNLQMIENLKLND